MTIFLFSCVLIVLAIVIEINFVPRLDYTRNHKLLLWYNCKKGRKYIVLM